MTRWLDRWIDNGGRTRGGSSVNYMNAFVYIDDAWEDMGRDVISFELIGSEDNNGADRLANMVLDNEARRSSSVVG